MTTDITRDARFIIQREAAAAGRELADLEENLPRMDAVCSELGRADYRQRIEDVRRRAGDLGATLWLMLEEQERRERDEQPPSKEELREVKRIAGQRRRAAGAARRLVEFVSCFGSGDIWGNGSEGPNCTAEDIETVCRVVLGEPEVPRAEV